MEPNEFDDEMISVGTALVNALALAGAISLGSLALLSEETPDWRIQTIVLLGTSLLSMIATFQILIAFRKIAQILSARFEPMNVVQRIVFSIVLTFVLISAIIMVSVATLKTIGWP